MPRLTAAIASLAFVLAPSAGKSVAFSLSEPTQPARSPVLPFPELLEDNIRFWESVYRDHPSNRMVVHDREDPSVIWRVFELPTKPDGSVDEAEVSTLVRSQVEEVKQRLLHLEAGAPPRDDEDRVLTQLAGDDPSRLLGAAQRLRSQRGVADKFALAIRRAAQWSASIRPILAEEGVPEELCFLPFIESMWNPQAKSAAGAAGLWQLMPATARWLGLKVSGAVDERLDMHKATRAAARLLRKNFEMLGSWPLAITAYNHGHNGLSRAVREAGSADLVYLIRHYEKPNWGFSSKNFYAGFLAAWRSYNLAAQRAHAAGSAAVSVSESEP